MNHLKKNRTGKTSLLINPNEINKASIGFHTEGKFSNEQKFRNGESKKKRNEPFASLPFHLEP